MEHAPDPSLGDLLAGHDPGRTAFVDGTTGDRLHWGELVAAAAHWRQLGGAVGHGARVGLLAGPPLESARSVLGALGAGVLVAPLDPGASTEEAAKAAERLGLCAVVADPTCVDLARQVSARTGAAVHVAAAAGIEQLEAGRPDAGLPAPAPAAMLMSSSGTTGEPKLIPLGEDALVRTAGAVVAAHQLGPDDIGYSPLPLFHINGLVVGLVSTALTGATLVVDRRFSARRFWPTVRTHDVTWCNLVPAIIGILGRQGAPDDGAGAGRVRFARSASAPLSAAARETFERHTGIPVVETYGMTEAASQICANPLDPHRRRPGTVGLPTDVEVTVRPGTGEVLLRGRRVVHTYWTPGSVATRAAVDAGGWLATGDLGALDADGYLTLAGRVDDVINRGGEKVLPREVEEVLLADPDVAAAAVVGRPDPLLGSVPVAFVTLAERLAGDDAAAAAVADRLAATVRARLSRPKRPVEVVVVEALPTGATGKVRHAAIRRTMGGGPDALRVRATTSPEPTDRPPAVAARTPDAPPTHHEVNDVPDTPIAMPTRTAKPRSSGLTMVIDGGQPTGFFLDAMRSAAPHVDVVKLGWGTALVTPDLDVKLAALAELGIDHYFGGTLFEKFVTQDQFDAFLDFAAAHGASKVEISNGTIPMTNTGKAAYIRKAADRFTVVSEVGFKDAEKSGRFSPSQWIDAIWEDLEAGSSLVITEARESGSSGICSASGELRNDLIEDILASGLPTDRLLFEAPTKKLQTFFVTRVGTNVNLGNIPIDQVIAVETLRLGLRADTLMHVEQELAEDDAWQPEGGSGA